MKKILFLTLFFLIPSTSFASVQVIVTRMSGNGVSVGTRYIAVGGFSAVVGSDTNATIVPQVPVAGTFGSLHVNAEYAPTSTDTIKVTLRKNGVNSSLTCTIAAGTANCADTTASHALTVVQGDKLTYEVVYTGNSFISSVSMSLNFVPTTPNDTILMTQSTGPSNSAENFNAPAGTVSAVSAVAQSQRNVPFVVAGTLDMFVASTTAPGAGKTWDFTLMNNNASTTVTCRVDGSAPNFCADNSNTLAVVVGDQVNIASVPVGTPAATTMSGGMRFRPANSGDFLFVFTNGSSNDSATVVNYHPISGAGAPTTAEASSTQIANFMTITGLYVKNGSNIAGGTTRTFTLRKNYADTPLTCTITSAGTTCSASASVFVADGDLLSLADTPSGSPTAGPISFSLVANTAPRVNRNTFLGGFFRLKGGFFRFK